MKRVTITKDMTFVGMTGSIDASSEILVNGISVTIPFEAKAGDQISIADDTAYLTTDKGTHVGRKRL